MKRLILVTSFVLVAVFPVSAIAQSPTPHHVREYLHAYHAVRSHFGPSAAGCNLIERRGSCHIRATDEAVLKSLGVLDRTLAPPPQPIYRQANYTPTQTVYHSTVQQDYTVRTTTTSASLAYATQQPTSYSSYSGGGGCSGNTPYSGGGQCWAIPYSIVSCESGGQNVPNSQGSGANGYYQLMSGGDGSKSQQDAAAAALWAGGRGASNWTCAR